MYIERKEQFIHESTTMDSLLIRPLLSSPRPPSLFFSSRCRRGSCVPLQYSVCQKRDTIDRCSIGVNRRQLLEHGCANVKSVYSGSFQEISPIKATSGHPLESEPEKYNSMITWKSVLTSLNVLYRFSRPHTVIGTALSIVSVSLLAIERLSDISPLFFTGMLEAVVAALFMNIYVVGLNQLYDIEIDKLNKPDLPLACGDYSHRVGTVIIATSAVMSFGIGWLVGSWPLSWALLISFILGTAYSVNLPFLRWKRFPVLAAMCILAVRAVVVQLAFFLHMQTFVYRRPPNFSRTLIFATAFMSFFSVVIALFKDIPDIDGDRIYGIRSFTVHLGQKRVFWICVYLLEMAYSVAVGIGATSSCLWSKIITVLCHGILASILWKHARSLDKMNKATITSFYMFIWKLFYAEYLLIPLVR